MIVKIPQKANWILEQLEAAGYEGYVVGGCVRDAIIGREPADWDITTSALPEDVKRIFQRTIDTGIEHGTVTVMCDKEGFEVTTYRLDGKYSDHRHPDKVEFAPCLEEDLKRRDFTINAMAYNPKTGLIDLYGGERDLELGIIRCVGNPLERFDEDALRMLRGVRFAGQLGFDIEKDTLEAMRSLSHTIVNVSAERVRVELTKLLLSDNPDKLVVASELGLLTEHFPEFKNMLETEQNNPHHRYTVGIHSLKAVEEIQKIYKCFPEDEICSPYRHMDSDVKTETILSLAALLHDVGKPSRKTTDDKGIDHFYGHDVVGEKLAKEILRRLKFDNKTIDMVSRLVRYHEYRYRDGLKKTRRFFSKVGKDAMSFLLVLQRADIRAQSEYLRGEKESHLDDTECIFKGIMINDDPMSISELDISGGDIIGLGVEPGPEVGELLRELLDHVVVNPEDNKRDILVEMVKKALGTRKSRR